MGKAGMDTRWSRNSMCKALRQNNKTLQNLAIFCHWGSEKQSQLTVVYLETLWPAVGFFPEFLNGASSQHFFLLEGKKTVYYFRGLI